MKIDEVTALQSWQIVMKTPLKRPKRTYMGPKAHFDPKSTFGPRLAARRPFGPLGSGKSWKIVSFRG